MSNNSFDVIILGCGPAGLSLAWNLIRSSYQFSSLLLIGHKDTIEQPGRYLSFWSKEESPLTEAAFASWDNLDCATPHRRISSHISPYRLYVTDWHRLTSSLRSGIEQDSRVSFLKTHATIQDGTKVITREGETYEASWVFDSSFPSDLPEHTLYMHTSTLDIETESPAFNPGHATLFDYSRSSKPGLFHYVLPITASRAIVQSVLWSTSAESQHNACSDSIQKFLQGTAHSPQDEQYGIIPLFQVAKPRDSGKVIPIGLSGGLIKASTGYGLTNIWRDSVSMVQSLESHGHPYKRHEEPWLSKQCDRMLLQAIRKNPAVTEVVFMRLFGAGKSSQALGFLDGAASFLSTILIMARVTPWPFLKAYVTVRRSAQLS